MRIHFKFIVQLVLAVTVSSAFGDAYVDFFRAVNLDNTRIVRDLLNRGFDPNAVNEKGQRALYVAIADESPKVAALLISHPHTEVDAANAAGETPLMMAALRGEPELARQIIERGGRVNREGWTPLHYAASGTEDTVMPLLLARGAQVDARSPNGSTPLMLAAQYGTENAVALLLGRGADPRLVNARGLRAADFARLAGRDELAQRLERLAR